MVKPRNKATNLLLKGKQKATSIDNAEQTAKQKANIDFMFDSYRVTIQNIHSLSAIEKMNLVRAGINKNDLDKIKKQVGIDYDLLASALSVTRATLINKKGTSKFNKKVSEGIVGLTDIYSYGYEVFQDIDGFNNWMLKPNIALGGKAPSEFLDNQFGREEVRNIIGRINYGVYS